MFFGIRLSHSSHFSLAFPCGRYTVTPVITPRDALMSSTWVITNVLTGVDVTEIRFSTVTPPPRWLHGGDTNDYIFESCTMEIHMCSIDCGSVRRTACTCERERKKLRERDTHAAQVETFGTHADYFQFSFIWWAGASGKFHKWILMLLAFNGICLTPPPLPPQSNKLICQGERMMLF